jgi:hypothetical protein
MEVSLNTGGCSNVGITYTVWGPLLGNFGILKLNTLETAPYRKNHL